MNKKTCEGIVGWPSKRGGDLLWILFFLVEFERALVLFQKRNLKIKRERWHRFDKSFCFFLISKKNVLSTENKNNAYSSNIPMFQIKNKLSVMKINWKEIFKFLSGAFFVTAGASLYFAYNKVDLPFMETTMTHEFLYFRGALHFVLFLITLYFGFIKKSKS